MIMFWNRRWSSSLARVQPTAKDRTAKIFEIRASPRQIARRRAQSQMLEQQPIVEKTRRREEEWRQSQLALSDCELLSNGQKVQQRIISVGTQGSESGSASTQRKDNDLEYYAFMSAGVAGLIFGMYAADYFFEDPKGVRLLYDPTVGFLPLIEEFERRSDRFSSLVSYAVASHIEASRAKG